MLAIVWVTRLISQSSCSDETFKDDNEKFNSVSGVTLFYR